MTRVLVTGATGFLGTRVVRAAIDRGWTVTAHGRTAAASPVGGVEYVRGDLADAATARRLLSPWRWDVVVNLAGPVTGGAEDLHAGIGVVTAHVHIALQLRSLAARARIVHASSMTVYGMPERLPIDEAHPRRPMHLYGLGKQLAEEVLLGDAALDVWALRLPGLFAESRRGGALYHFCAAARDGTPLRVTTPTPTPWDVLHVDDACAAIVAAIAAPGRGLGAINVSYGEPVELVAIAEMIARLAGKGSRVEHPEGVVHPTFHLEIAKARAAFGWSPPTLYARLERYYAALAEAA